MLALMFGQLSNRESLRDLIVALEAHRSKCHHLGMGKHVTRSNLAKANEKRDCRINLLDSFFVIRSKNNPKYRIVKWKRKLPKNVMSDAVIELTGFYPSKNYPRRLRPISYWDEEQGREFMFLTNAFGLSAMLVAELYKNLWQIELFFKWLKQHLRIKKFWGTSENAVKTQIYVAIINYCLVAIVQHVMHLDRSTYEVLQILSISLTDKASLKDLFNNTNCNNIKEQTDSGELLLFNT